MIHLEEAMAVMTRPIGIVVDVPEDGNDRARQVAEHLKRQIVEGECPACHARLERGVCSCCGEFNVQGSRITLFRTDCSHWPLELPRG